MADIRKYEIDRLQLLAAVNKVVGATAGGRTITAILDYLRINITLGGKILITAGDLEIFADTECEIEHQGAGVGFCAPAVKFKGALSAIGSETIELSWRENNSICLDGDGLHYGFEVLPYDDYPQPLSVEPSPAYAFHPRQLTRMLKAVSHATSTDSTKYNLSGINLSSETDRNDQLTACATDGYRISVAGLNLQGSVESLPQPVTIPNKAAHLITDIAGTIELVVDKTKISVSTPGLDLSAQLIAGDYPAWRRAIPSDHNLMLTLNRSQFIEAIAAVGIIGDKSKSITIIAETDQLEIRALGQNSISTATLPYTGDDALRITVNSKYLISALKALEGEEVFIKHKAEHCSALLLYPGDTGPFDERFEMIMGARETNS
jgi:DNA polymerase-3 subunit beta